MPIHEKALDWLYKLGFEETSSEGHEHRGDCPICGKENEHFSFNSEKGVFNCFSCGESGTYPQLLGLLAEQHELAPDSASLKALARRRGIPVEAFHGYGIGAIDA